MPAERDTTIGTAASTNCNATCSSKSAKITAAALRELLHRNGYRCALTGAELTPDTAAIDFILPPAKGGSHDISNVQIVHVDARAAKGNLTLDEFLAVCRAVTARAAGGFERKAP